MRFIIVLLITLFVFLGMFIGKKYDLKYFSINSIFSLFLVNGLFNIFLASNYLSINYHDTTWIYLILCGVVGFILMKIIGIKSDNPDDVSITCFSFLNCFILFTGKLNFLIFLVNVIYYVLIGIYIKDSKSNMYVFLGFILSFIASFISSWMLGYLMASLIGIIIYFLFSIYNVVIRNSAYVGIVVGILVGIIGAII